MDDIMGKLGEILSDPESIKQITELAQMFMSETADNKKNPSENTENPEVKEISENSGDGLFSGVDFSKLMKIQEIMGAVSGKDKNAETAPRPETSSESRKAEKSRQGNQAPQTSDNLEYNQGQRNT